MWTADSTLYTGIASYSLKTSLVAFVIVLLLLFYLESRSRESSRFTLVPSLSDVPGLKYAGFLFLLNFLPVPDEVGETAVDRPPYQSVDATLFFAAPGFNAAEVVGTKAAGIGSKRSRRYIIN